MQEQWCALQPFLHQYTLYTLSTVLEVGGKEKNRRTCVIRKSEVFKKKPDDGDSTLGIMAHCRLRHTRLITYLSLKCAGNNKSKHLDKTCTCAGKAQDGFVSQISAGSEVLHSFKRRCCGKQIQLINQLSSSLSLPNTAYTKYSSSLMPAEPSQHAGCSVSGTDQHILL